MVSQVCINFVPQLNFYFFFYCLVADEKSFHSLDCLRAHINKCQLPKRFHCDRCHYKTNQTGHLKRHRTNVHGLSDDLQIKKWRHEQ